VQQVGFDSLWL